MKNNLQIINFIIMILVSSSIYGQKSDKTQGPSWRTVSQGYSVRYPPSWDFDSSGHMKNLFIIFSPRENEKDFFLENVNFFIEDLGNKGYDLDKYINLTLGQIQSIIPRWFLIENQKSNSAHGSFQKLIYTGVVKSQRLKFEQYIWVRDNKDQVLTLSVELSKWDQYKEIGESILKSFVPNFGK